MKKLFKLGNIMLLIAGVFLAMQLFRIDKSNPESKPELDYITITRPPAELSELIRNACYDCHSNETEYPWYTNIAPFSWSIKSHIKEGREHLNFSEWGSYKPGRQGHKLDECKEMIAEGEMPLSSYQWMHAESRLSQAENEELVNWFTVE